LGKKGEKREKNWALAVWKVIFIKKYAKALKRGERGKAGTKGKKKKKKKSDGDPVNNKHGSKVRGEVQGV